MPKTILKYSGGKSKYAETILAHLPQYTNGRFDGIFGEAFAGGASVSLQSNAKNLVLVEKDPRIASIWRTILCESDTAYDAFKSEVLEAYEEINKMRAKDDHEAAKVTAAKFFAFADTAHSALSSAKSFMLNRWSNSAAVMRRPIGGKFQTGKYKIFCRFNAPKLMSDSDAIRKSYFGSKVFSSSIFDINLKSEGCDAIYFDPPYFVWGKEGGLYDYHFTKEDHTKLCAYATAQNIPFVMSYDAISSYTNIPEDENFFWNLMNDYWKFGCEKKLLIMTQHGVVKANKKKSQPKTETLLVYPGKDNVNAAEQDAKPAGPDVAERVAGDGQDGSTGSAGERGLENQAS